MMPPYGTDCACKATVITLSHTALYIDNKEHESDGYESPQRQTATAKECPSTIGTLIWESVKALKCDFVTKKIKIKVIHSEVNAKLSKQMRLLMSCFPS